MMKAIGGYFGLEIDRGKHYHAYSCVRLSTGRACFEYILLVRKYKKIYIPFYTCEVLLEPIVKLGIAYEFYSIDNKFSPIIPKSINLDEGILYTNYFGLKQNIVTELAKKYKTLIIDNAQAFYALPISNVDTFYSARKFFGVPDGAYLYIDKSLNRDIPLLEVENISRHLIGRLANEPEFFYEDFIKAEAGFVNKGIHRMSILTESVLSSINYEKVKRIRRENYEFLNKELGQYNELLLTSLSESDVPLVYPLFIDKEGLRRYLISKRIYISQYWQCVLNWTRPSSLEYKLSSGLCPLPIDQRYQKSDMETIIREVMKYIKNN